MQFFAVFFAVSSIVITLICLILLIQRLILDYFTDSTLPIAIRNNININEPESDGKLIKRLKYLNSPITNFKLYENIEIISKILPIFLINRILILTINFVFYVLENSGKTLRIDCFRDIWGKWDTTNYLSIAQHGYQNIGDERFLIVFYPLYPFLISIFNGFVGDYFLSGVIVSNVFLIISLFYIYRLVQIELEKDKIAFNSVKYILLFPFSFFFSIAYTESVFMCLCIMTFYFLRKKNWLLSGLMGFFAALTRTQGILLLIPIMTEILYEYKGLNKSTQTNNAKNHPAIYLQIIISLLLVPCGTFGYLLINKFVSGEWLTFLIYQKEHWGQNFGFFAENIKNSFILTFTMNEIMAVNVWIPQIILFFISFGILIYTAKNIRISYALFSFAYILMSFSPTWLLSGSRYITGMFTLFIMLSILVYKHKYLEIYLDFILTMLLCFYCIQFSLSRVY
jgi:Gpi18-like mannosyltransferase